MCLSVPGKILSIEGDAAKVSVGGTVIDTNLQLIDNAKAGEYVLVHSGFALERISEEEANETLRLFDELNKMQDEG
jgi:hydrogenase expression/formation protein HypC